MNDIQSLRAKSKLTQKDFSQKYGIPLRTLQKWERNGSEPPEYIPKLIERVMLLENTELFMEVFWKDEKTAAVRLDEYYAYISRYTKHPVKQIFYNEKITRFELGEILTDRCWDPKRPDINRILELMGLDEFNPYEICRRTHGRMYQDNIWFRFPGEKITFEELNYV